MLDFRPILFITGVLMLPLAVAMCLPAIADASADNPDWQRDWSDPSTCPASGEVGDWRDKMAKTHPGWKDIMKNKVIPKAPRNKTITDKYNY